MQIPSPLIPQLASTLRGIPSTDTVLHYQVTQHHQQPHINLAELGAASHTPHSFEVKFPSQHKGQTNDTRCSSHLELCRAERVRVLQKGTYCEWFLGLLKCANLLCCLDNELICVVISNVCVFIYVYRCTPIATEVCSNVKAGLMILVRIKLNCWKNRNHRISTVSRDDNPFPAKTF